METSLNESIAAALLLVLDCSSLNKRSLLFQWVFYPQAFQNRCLLENVRPIRLALAETDELQYRIPDGFH